jgi:tRNA(fMet)-specific endonuclease VapC
MYFLDTNICVYLISGRYESLNQKFLSIKPEQLVVSALVGAEFATQANKTNVLLTEQ